LYLLDIGVSKKMEIPLPNKSVSFCRDSARAWHEPGKILFGGQGSYSVLNLDTLQIEVILGPRNFSTYGPLKPAERDALKKEEAEYKARQSALDRQLSRQNDPRAYIHTGYNGDGLLLSALDDSYHKLLLSGTFYNGNFDVSPNFGTVVFHRLDSELNYVRLGKTKARPAKFMLAFNRREQLSQSQQQDFEKFWQGVRVRSDDSLENGDLAKPSFWGDVYEPQVNPLTGKVVGPNQQKPKGRVIFESTTDTYSIVRTYFESAPIGVGDIVTNFRSDMVGGHGFSAGEIIWLPLKSAQGVPAEANTKETKQESGIESNKEVASLETQRGSTGSAMSELSRFLSLPIASKEEFKKFGEAELHRAEQAEGPSNRNVLNLRKQAAGAMQGGRWSQAVEAYNQILAIDPEDWNAWLMLSSSYNELRQPDQTLAYATKALKRIQYSALYAIVGVAYGQKGDKEKFLTWLEKAVDGGSPLNPKAIDQSFPQYRDDPKYKAIMQKYQSR